MTCKTVATASDAVLVLLHDNVASAARNRILLPDGEDQEIVITREAPVMIDVTPSELGWKLKVIR